MFQTHKHTYCVYFEFLCGDEVNMTAFNTDVKKGFSNGEIPFFPILLCDDLVIMWALSLPIPSTRGDSQNTASDGE